MRCCACWDRADALAPSVPREFRDAHWATWQETADNPHAMRAGRELLAAGDEGPDLYLWVRWAAAGVPGSGFSAERAVSPSARVVDIGLPDGRRLKARGRRG